MGYGRNRTSSYSLKLGQKIALQAILFIVITLTGFAIGHFIAIGNGSGIPASYETGRTMAILPLIVQTMIKMIQERKQK